MKNLKLVLVCIAALALLLGCDDRDATFYDVGMVSTFSGLAIIRPLSWTSLATQRIALP